jgi:hypothetical protein
MYEKVKIAVEKLFTRMAYGLHVHVVADKNMTIKDIVWEEVNEGAIYSPTMILDETEAQALIDSLWDCGLRPTEGTGSAGALAAAQANLEDLRRVAFTLLDKND